MTSCFVLTCPTPTCASTATSRRACWLCRASKDVTLEFNSLSKSHHMAGWRTGMAVGNAVAVKALLQTKSNIDSGIFRPIQDAATAALNGDNSWMVARNAEYQQRRDMILETIRAIGMEADTPKASLYVWALPPKGYGSIEFADKVLLETGVSFTPGDAYGPSGKGYIRISMGTETKKIAEAMARRAWLSYRLES